MKRSVIDITVASVFQVVEVLKTNLLVLLGIQLNNEQNVNSQVNEKDIFNSKNNTLKFLQIMKELESVQ